MGSKVSSRSHSSKRSVEVISAEQGFLRVDDYNTFSQWYDTRIGADDPKYKSKILSGLCATNFLEASKWDIKILSPGSFDLVVTGDYPYKGLVGKVTWLGNDVSNVNIWIDPSTLSACENDAALGVRKKVRDVIQSFSGLTFLGELRESIKMIRHPAAGLEALLRKFIGDHNPRRWKEKQWRSGIRKARRSDYIKDLGDQWLELSFGVAPLVSDIQSIALENLDTFEVDNIKRVFFTAHRDEAPLFDFEHNTSSETRVDIQRIDVTGCDVNFIAGVRRKVDMDGFLSLQNLSNRVFRLDDIIPTAWELLPWSFLIDYFSNIGDVLSANYMSESNIAWSQRTRRVSRDKTFITYQATPYAPHVYSVRNFVHEIIRSEARWVDRSAAVIPYVTARFELPSKIMQFSNMTALLASQRKISF